MNALRVLATVFPALCAAAVYGQDKPASEGKQAAPPPFAAQDKGPRQTAAPLTISSGPVGVSGAAPRGRAISSGMAGALLSSLPDFDAPPKEDLASAPPADMPESPKNGIIRIDPMVVQGDKALPIFTERNLHTNRDLATIMVQRYLSELDRGILNRWHLPLFGISKEKRAMQMYLDDERLRNMAELKEDANNAQRAGDTEQSEYIRKISSEAFNRQIPWGFNSQSTRNRQSAGN